MSATTKSMLGQASAPYDGKAPPIRSSVPEQGQHIPVLALENLHDIAVDTGGPDLAINFLDDYMHLLHVRMSRILAAMNAEDTESIINAALSLKTASGMAGALEIEAGCGDLLASVAGKSFHLAHDVARALRDKVERTAAASPALREQAKAHLGTPA